MYKIIKILNDKSKIQVSTEAHLCGFTLYLPLNTGSYPCSPTLIQNNCEGK